MLVEHSGPHPPIHSVCTSIAQDLDFISSDEGYEESRKYFTSRKATLSHYASCTDLDMTEDEADGVVEGLGGQE